jgi:DNA polymerase-1
VGEGAKEIRAIYAADPDADYHAIVGALIEKLTGLVLDRGKVKTINFGIIYGMALNALSVALGLSKPEAKKLLDDYHAAAPYARATMDMCANEVHSTGMVRTILNRVSDFEAWGPKGWSEENVVYLDYTGASRKWGMFNIERKSTHKALNRKLQGSAADVMKKAMVEAYEAGLFEEDACGMPILTVHDELDFEDKGDLDNPAWESLRHIMENCMGDLLKVPLRVDSGIGPTWREAH